MTHKKINQILITLILIDITIFIWAFFFPDLWFKAFHGAEYIDPQGLLRRSAASWAAFALFQFLALKNWQKNSAWLAIAAGIRFGDIFTDLVYVIFAANLTWFGWLDPPRGWPDQFILGQLAFQNSEIFELVIFFVLGFS